MNWQAGGRRALFQNCRRRRHAQKVNQAKKNAPNASRTTRKGGGEERQPGIGKFHKKREKSINDGGGIILGGKSESVVSDLGKKPKLEIKRSCTEGNLQDSTGGRGKKREQQKGKETKFKGHRAKEDEKTTGPAWEGHDTE